MNDETETAKTELPPMSTETKVSLAISDIQTIAQELLELAKAFRKFQELVIKRFEELGAKKGNTLTVEELKAQLEKTKPK